MSSTRAVLDRDERLSLVHQALDPAARSPMAWWSMPALGLMIGGMVLGVSLVMRGGTDSNTANVIAGGALVLVACAAFLLFSRRGRRLQAEREAWLAARVAGRGFAIEGYLDWLGAPEGQLRVLLAKPVPSRPAIPHGTWTTDRELAVTLPPTTLRPARGRAPALRSGDHAAFDALLGETLVPLHEKYGIERVVMGDR